MSTAGRLKIAVTWGKLAGSVPNALIWSVRPGLNAAHPAFIFRAAAKAAGRSTRWMPRAADSSGGICIPKSLRKETT